MKKNLIIFFLVIVAVNISSQEEEPYDVINAIYYKLEKNTFVVVDISKHNLYVKEPYFVEPDTDNLLVKDVIGIIFDEYLLQLMFSADINILRIFSKPSPNEKIYILNKDGLEGLLKLIIEYALESGTTPDKIFLGP
ncbi:MAG: hypothetical protein LBQ55_06995 [Treponema sp.]|jgi:hypothetical protein|nr:hypothetical protein [Treponema sp.]